MSKIRFIQRKARWKEEPKEVVIVDKYKNPKSGLIIQVRYVKSGYTRWLYITDFERLFKSVVEK